MPRNTACRCVRPPGHQQRRAFRGALDEEFWSRSIKPEPRANRKPSSDWFRLSAFKSYLAFPPSTGSNVNSKPNLNPYTNSEHNSYPALKRTHIDNSHYNRFPLEMLPKQLSPEQVSYYWPEKRCEGSSSSQITSKVGRPDYSRFQQLICPDVSSGEDIESTGRERHGEQMHVIKIEECDSERLSESRETEQQGSQEIRTRSTLSSNDGDISREPSPKQTPIDLSQSFEIKEVNEEKYEEGWQIQSPSRSDSMEDSVNLHVDTVKREGNFEHTRNGVSSEENLVNILPVTHIKEESDEEYWHRENTGAALNADDHGYLEMEINESASSDEQLSHRESSKENYSIFKPMITVKQELRDSD